MSIACLPWYELPETRDAQDRLWSVIARHLESEGVPEVPPHLTRGLSTARMLSDPGLICGQCCGYDIVYGFGEMVRLVATPAYDAPGCEGANYRSFILVREDSGIATLEALRGRVCVVNGFNSHSGTNALRALVAPLSRGGRFFSALKVSGAHMNSLAMLLAGEADVMAMDCVLHALLLRHRPQALAGTRIIETSDAAPAPPFVCAAGLGPEASERLARAIAAALADDDAKEARAAMLLGGILLTSRDDYARIAEIEGIALGRGYLELHATSPILVP
jgi:hypothetical protein